MDHLTVSVIVPAYNVAQWLPRCLDSILRQTHRNLEIVVVDDGSTDETFEIMEHYVARDHRIKAFHQENGGVTSARLRGAVEASGEWIGFVDGDDKIEPDMYERLLRNALEYDVEISHCGYQMRFADGRVNYFHNTGLLEKQDTVAALRELLSGERVEPGLCNKLFHRSLFEGLSMPLDIRINEDLLMNFYLFSRAKQTVFDDWCPYHYIVRSTSASRAALNDHKIYDPIRVKEIILESASDEVRPDAQRAFVNTCVYSYCGLLLAKGTDVRQAKKVFRCKLQKNKAWIALLSTRAKILACLIIYLPRFFQIIYPVYASHFQKSKYE